MRAYNVIEYNCLWRKTEDGDSKREQSTACFLSSQATESRKRTEVRSNGGKMIFIKMEIKINKERRLCNQNKPAIS